MLPRPKIVLIWFSGPPFVLKYPENSLLETLQPYNSIVRAFPRLRNIETKLHDRDL